MLKIKSLMFFTLVIAIFAFIAAAEVGAECIPNPNCYSDPPNNVCYGNGIWDSGEPDNTVIASGANKAVIEICPDPVTGNFGELTADGREFEYWITNNKTEKRAKFIHHMQGWDLAESPIPPLQVAPHPDYPSSVILRGPGVGSYDFLVGASDKVVLEINHDVQPGESGGVGYFAFPANVGLISLALDTQDVGLLTFPGQLILGPVPQDIDPVNLRYDFTFSEVFEGELVTCTGYVSMLTSPPTVFVNEGCNATVFNPGDVLIGPPGDQEPIIKLGQAWTNAGCQWYPFGGYPIRICPN